MKRIVFVLLLSAVGCSKPNCIRSDGPRVYHPDDHTTVIVEDEEWCEVSR